jgi:hypothetical protein
MVNVNIISISGTDEKEIAEDLKARGLTSLHCTNGTYSYSAELIIPTTLAGFRYINDRVAVPGDVFLVAVNSDISMKSILDQKGASDAERQAMEDQNTRAMKVAVPLAWEFSDRTIVVVFYDKPTPADLYNMLASEALVMESLHKHGYGTDPKAPKIEGAGNFHRVFAFPLPNDTRPVCHELTAVEDQSAIIRVVKLTDEMDAHGRPYLHAPDSPPSAAAAKPATPRVV